MNDMEPLFNPVSRQSRHSRYNQSDKGKRRRAKYRHDNSKHQTDAQYLSRDFCMWDGEGITLDSGEHLYVMLAHSKGGYLFNANGIPTMDIFRFLLREHAKYPDDIHVIYGGSYDFNMWLSHVPQHTLEGIYTHDYYRYGNVTIQWRRGKSFYLRNDKEDGTRSKGMTIYDVVSFFQCSFVKACDQYLGDQFQHRDTIVENKLLRSSFTYDDIQTVKRYNEYELANGVALMQELRARLNKVGLRPKRWDGPGAIAAALMSRERVKDSLTPSPEDVAEAARYAYAGGRFEVIQYGAARHKVYEYDVNSAYPHALRNVPNLTRGEWHTVSDPDPATDPAEFALWHVEFKGSDYRLPQPLFWRSYKGNIVYPGDHSFYGWYWTPDIVAAQEYVKRYGGTLTLRRKHTFIEENELDRPFAFIPELYHQRQLLKAKGDGAQVGIKLALNSLYGKLAQQVGARIDPTTSEYRIPPFHQLEYAGYVTATCRSMVYLAAIENLASVVAYETDALFTTEPLDIARGEQLGEWEETVFDNLTYVQSGLYFGTKEDGKEVAKTRGVNLGSLTRDKVETAMQSRIASERIAKAELTQFITAGLALQGRYWDWRRWITTEKTINLEPQGKRCPIPGDFGTLCRTFATRVPPQSHSAQFPVIWINPDEGMIELEELRNNGTAEYYDLMDGYGEL